MEMTHLNTFRTHGGVNLIGGGDVSDEQLDQIRESNLPVYCADAGLLEAKSAGLTISGVIGDLDTVGTTAIENVPIAYFPDQNSTDFDKSLSMIDAQYILCYGFLGRRLDHSLASISSIAKSDKTAFVINEMDFCAVCPPHLNLNLPVGSRVSLFPVVPTKARSTGLEYNVNGIDLSPIGMISTSNNTNEPQIDIWIDSGVALVVMPRSELASVLEQWPTQAD
jgi:thiamine pyrophosphokinase